MVNTAELSVLENLKAGMVDLDTLKSLARLRMGTLVTRLRSRNPAQFLNRKQREKWEVGLAEAAVKAKTANGGFWHTYYPCLFVTGERGRITTLATVARVR